MFQPAAKNVPRLQAIQTPQATRCVAVATNLRADVRKKWSDTGPLQMAV